MRKGLIALCILVLLVGCSKPSNNKNLAASLEEGIEYSAVEELDLNDYTSFQWDEAHLFFPYTSDEKINEVLGFKFNGPKGLIEGNDKIHLLIFVYSNQAVEYAEIRLASGVELVNESNEVITPENAILQIKRQ